MRTMIKPISKGALGGIQLDWERELCKQGCREWIPWYKNKKGKTVYGCRIGVIPEKNNGQRCCRHRKPKNRKDNV